MQSGPSRCLCDSLEPWHVRCLRKGRVPGWDSDGCRWTPQGPWAPLRVSTGGRPGIVVEVGLSYQWGLVKQKVRVVPVGWRGRCGLS